MSSHTYDLRTPGLYPNRHERPRDTPRNEVAALDGASLDREEFLWRHRRARRRIVRIVAIAVLVAATILLLFIANDAGARTALLDWSTMRGGHWSSNVPRWGY